MSKIPMLGVSGTVAGVYGAYLVLFSNHGISTLVPVPGFLTGFVLGSLASGLRQERICIRAFYEGL